MEIYVVFLYISKHYDTYKPLERREGIANWLLLYSKNLLQRK
jgi:hypothetical protein